MKTQIVIVLCLCLTAYGQLVFDEQPFTTYLGTDYMVVNDALLIDLAIAFANPCDRIGLSSFQPLPKNHKLELHSCDDVGCYKQTEVQHGDLKYTETVYELVKEPYASSLNLTGIDVGITPIWDEGLVKNVHVFKQMCNQQYKQVLNAIDSFATTIVTRKDYYDVKRPRQKRGAESFAAKLGWKVAETALDTIGSVGAAVGINIITDCIKVGIDYINPNSIPNRLNRVEESMNQVIKNQDLMRESLEALTNATTLINRKVDYLERYVRGEFQNSDLLNILRETTLSAINRVRTGLEELTAQKSIGLVSMLGITKIAPELNINGSLLRYPPKAARFISSQLLPADENNPLTLIIHYNLYDTNPTTKVAKVFGFPHWDLQPEVPQFLRYAGAPFVIFNEAINCAKGLSQPATSILVDDCNEEEFLDETIMHWEKHFTHHDPTKALIEPLIVHTNDYNLVYCFPKNITVYNATAWCPNAVIRLPVDQPFRTGKKVYNPKIVHKNAIVFDKIFDSIPPRHAVKNNGNFTHGMTDHLLMEVKAKLHQLEKQKAKTISVQKDWIWYVGKYCIFTVLIIIKLSILYCCFKFSCIAKLRWLFTQNHEPVQQNVPLEELESSPMRTNRPKSTTPAKIKKTHLSTSRIDLSGPE